MAWITISTNTTIIPLNGSVTLTIRTDQTNDDAVSLYINDVKVANDINPGYVNPFNYSYTFNTKGVYNVKCTHKGATSNVLTIYVDCDYAIVFDEDFYTTCNGACTVKACLTESDVPLSGETISLTGTGSTLTGTTDSDGVATFNLTGIDETKTLSASYGYESSDVTLFYFDTSTEFGSLYCLGNKLVTNLKAKGISGISFLDGLTTLVNEIPNIEPSIGGIVLDTALSCSASSNSVFVGDTVTFSGKLSCSFDDTQQTNDDMEGYIKTALIEIYDGNTLLGSTSTDNNGEYSYTYTTTTAGTMSIVASYDGTDYYDDCVSSAVSVVVNSVTPVPDSISLTADKSILSYADSESATLSATVLDQFDNPMENQTVEFFNGSTSMGTATTNASGVATKSYSSSGAGDVSFTAEVGSLVSETFALEDCNVFDTMTSSNAKWSVESGVSTNYSSSGVRVSANTWGAMGCLNSITTPSIVEYEITSITSGNTAYVNFWADLSDGNSIKFQTHISGSTLYCDTDSSNYSLSSNTGKYTYKIYSDKIELYKDGSLVKSYTVALSTLYIKFTPSNSTSRNFTFKNFKIKAL